MDLGAFSVSLAVKDIEASKEFYQKLGFKCHGRSFPKLVDHEKWRSYHRAFQGHV